MADEEDIKVEVDGGAVDAAAAQPNVEVEGQEPAAKEKQPVGDLTAQFKELEAQAARDRQAKFDAEHRERAAVAERETIRRESQETISASEAQAIEAGIAAADTEAKAAEAAYKIAFDAGDAAGMAASQRQMARAEARAVRLDEAKADIEARRSKQEKQQQRPEQQRQEQQLPPRSADWVMQHRDWVNDPKKWAKVLAGHHDAIAEGVVPETDAYFEHIETFIGLRQKSEPEKKEEPQRNTNGQFARRQTPPAAPVRATGGGMNGGSDNVVRLSQKEAAAATDGTLVWNYDDPQKKFKKGEPIGTQEFARRKREMTKHGLYDKSYLEQ